MKRWLPLAVLCGIGIAQTASAQAIGNIGNNGTIGAYNQPQWRTRSGVSPYLNLTIPGDPAVNYFGIVRPQIETQRGLQNLQTEVQQLDNGLQTGGLPVAAPGAMTGVTTGHPVAFFAYSNYFPFYSRAGIGAATPGGGVGGLLPPRVGNGSNISAPPSFSAGGGGIGGGNGLGGGLGSGRR